MLTGCLDCFFYWLMDCEFHRLTETDAILLLKLQSISEVFQDAGNGKLARWLVTMALGK